MDKVSTSAGFLDVKMRTLVVSHPVGAVLALAGPGSLACTVSTCSPADNTRHSTLSAGQDRPHTPAGGRALLDQGRAGHRPGQDGHSKCRGVSLQAAAQPVRGDSPGRRQILLPRHHQLRQCPLQAGPGEGEVGQQDPRAASDTDRHGGRHGSVQVTRQTTQQHLMVNISVVNLLLTQQMG